MSNENTTLRAHLSGIVQRHLAAVRRHEAAEQRRASFRVVPAAPVTREAGEMAQHLTEMVRYCQPHERADLLAELIDKAERRGRVTAETAAHLRERAAELCASLPA